MCKTSVEDPHKINIRDTITDESYLSLDYNKTDVDVCAFQWL